MSDKGRRKERREITLKIGEKSKTIQGVTEYTTCSDIIKMVLRKSDSTKETELAYAIFESGSKCERMLSDQTRILKTMRSWGADNSYQLSLKAARVAGRIFRAKQEKVRRFGKLKGSVNVNSNIESAAKLAEFVQSQKSRLHRRPSRNQVTEIYCNDEGETSLDEFISNVDQTKMAGFLDFCGAVTANELVRLSGITKNSATEEHSPDFVKGKVVSGIDKINDVKYATKKVLKPKDVSLISGQTGLRLAKKHTFVECGYKNVPIHSTPSREETRSNIKCHSDLADDITSKVSSTNQKEGKDLILKKYFADYMCYNSPHRKPFPMPKRERGDGAEASFSTGNPDKGDGSVSTETPSLGGTTRGRHHSGSDSGQEDHYTEENLDTAFVCEAVLEQNGNDTRFAHVKSLSSKLVNYDETQVDKLVDYSLSDCSFTETNETSIDLAERNIFDEDEEMASFMDSKLHEELSDEGLSSLGSEDGTEIIV